MKCKQCGLREVHEIRAKWATPVCWTCVPAMPSEVTDPRFVVVDFAPDADDRYCPKCGRVTPCVCDVMVDR